MKRLNSFSIYDGKEHNNNYDFIRKSRWIKIKTNYTPSKRNPLWDYVTDDCGYGPQSERFNPVEGLYLDYFTYNGRNYAINQFMRIGGAFDCIGRHVGYIENGEKYYLSGYDSENYYNPMYIELDEYGENVRIYEEVTK